jgi:hypothetical protein
MLRPEWIEIVQLATGQRPYGTAGATPWSCELILWNRLGYDLAGHKCRDQSKALICRRPPKIRKSENPNPSRVLRKTKIRESIEWTHTMLSFARRIAAKCRGGHLTYWTTGNSPSLCFSRPQSSERVSFMSSNSDRPSMTFLRSFSDRGYRGPDGDTFATKEATASLATGT